MRADSRCHRLRLLVVMILAPLFLQMLACGASETQSSSTRANLTGSWQLTTTVTSNTCGLPNAQNDPEIISLRDSSDMLYITAFSGSWGEGDPGGNTIQFTGSETSDDLGCEAAMETDGLGSFSATSITGTFVTSVSFNQDSCPGRQDCEITIDFTMTKLEECDCLDRAEFGEPASSDYVLPFPVGASYPVYQSYCCPTAGHRCQLACDFTMPIGSPVVAARGGVVRQVKEDSPDDGEGVGEHNFVHIEHEDGTAAFYAHLMQHSVSVVPGDTLETGEQFASSGNSGYSDEPHLHIQIFEDYPMAEGHDLPVNFRNADGPLDARGGLIRGETYRALQYR